MDYINSKLRFQTKAR